MSAAADTAIVAGGLVWTDQDDADAPIGHALAVETADREGSDAPEETS